MRTTAYTFKILSFILIISFTITNTIPAYGIDGPTLFKKSSYAQRYVKDIDKKATTNIIDSPESLAIAESLGRIVEYHKAKDPKSLVIHIQDKHMDDTAQFNISAIIDSLVANYNIKLISLEGASREINTSFYDKFPDSDIKTRITRVFVKAGLFTGPEYYRVTHSDTGARLIGAEDKDLYLKHLSSYRNSQQAKEFILPTLTQLSLSLDKIKATPCFKNLKGLEDICLSYQSRKISLNQYAEKITQHTPIGDAYPNLKNFLALVHKEKQIDFKKTQEQREDLIKYLADTLDKDKLKELFKNSLDFRLNKISDIAFYEYLQQFITQLEHLSPNAHNHLISYIEYLKLSKDIDHLKLLDEIDNLYNNLSLSLCVNDTQKKAVTYTKSLNLLKDLYNLKLTKDQLEYIQNNPKDFDISTIYSFIKDTSAKNNLPIPKIVTPDAINLSQNFYKLAIQRDIALTENTLFNMRSQKKITTILITGGFHTQGITNILKDKDISYIVICPNTSTQECERLYSDRMKGVLPDMDYLIDCLRNMLAPALVTGDIVDEPSRRFAETAFAKLLQQPAIPEPATRASSAGEGETISPPQPSVTEQEAKACRELALEIAQVYTDIKSSSFFREMTATKQQDRTPVTVADYLAQIKTTLFIQSHFPSDGLIGEEDIDLDKFEALLKRDNRLYEKYKVLLESYRQIAEWIKAMRKNLIERNAIWVVDPLDGTSEFLRQYGGDGTRYAFLLARLMWNATGQRYNLDYNIAYAPEFNTVFDDKRINGPMIESRNVSGEINNTLWEMKDDVLLKVRDGVKAVCAAEKQGIRPRIIFGRNESNLPAVINYFQQRYPSNIELMVSSGIAMMQLFLGHADIAYDASKLWDVAGLSYLMPEAYYADTGRLFMGFTKEDIETALRGGFVTIIGTSGGIFGNEVQQALKSSSAGELLWAGQIDWQAAINKRVGAKIIGVISVTELIAELKRKIGDKKFDSAKEFTDWLRLPENRIRGLGHTLAKWLAEDVFELISEKLKIEQPVIIPAGTNTGNQQNRQVTQLAANWKRAYCQQGMARLDTEAFEIFRQRFPNEAAELKKALTKTRVRFADIAGDFVMDQINTRHTLSFDEELRGVYEQQQRPKETLAVRSLISYPGAKSLLNTVFAMTNGGDSDSGVLRSKLVEYEAVKDSLRELNVFYTAQKVKGVPLRLPFLKTGRPEIDQLSYLDLATGTNFNYYLSDILGDRKRQLLLVDKSELVKLYWQKITEVLGLDNLRIIQADAMDIDRYFAPESIGTVRLCNVDTWLEGISDEWVQKLMRLLHPGGQILVTFNLADMIMELSPYQKTVSEAEMLDIFYRLSPVDRTVIKRLRRCIGLTAFSSRVQSLKQLFSFGKPKQFKWRMGYGHVDKDGNFVQGKTGFFNADYSAGNILVFEKMPAQAKASSAGEIQGPLKAEESQLRRRSFIKETALAGAALILASLTACFKDNSKEEARKKKEEQQEFIKKYQVTPDRKDKELIEKDYDAAASRIRELMAGYTAAPATFNKPQLIFVSYKDGDRSSRAVYCRESNVILYNMHAHQESIVLHQEDAVRFPISAESELMHEFLHANSKCHSDALRFFWEGVTEFFVIRDFSKRDILWAYTKPAYVDNVEVVRELLRSTDKYYEAEAALADFYFNGSDKSLIKLVDKGLWAEVIRLSRLLSSLEKDSAEYRLKAEELLKIFKDRKRQRYRDMRRLQEQKPAGKNLAAAAATTLKTSSARGITLDKLRQDIQVLSQRCGVTVTPNTEIALLLGGKFLPIHEWFAPSFRRADNFDGVILSYVVEPKDLPAVIEAIRQHPQIKGFLVTEPHKIAVADILKANHRDTLEGIARIIGSVNQVVKTADNSFVGRNNDGTGFVASYKIETREDFRDKKILLIGCGGAGRSLAAALCNEQPGQISFFDVKAESARELETILNASSLTGNTRLARLANQQGVKQAFAEADVIINATNDRDLTEYSHVFANIPLNARVIDIGRSRFLMLLAQQRPDIKTLSGVYMSVATNVDHLEKLFNLKTDYATMLAETKATWFTVNPVVKSSSAGETGNAFSSEDVQLLYAYIAFDGFIKALQDDYELVGKATAKAIGRVVRDNDVLKQHTRQRLLADLDIASPEAAKGINAALSEIEKPQEIVKPVKAAQAEGPVERDVLLKQLDSDDSRVKVKATQLVAQLARLKSDIIDESIIHRLKENMDYLNLDASGEAIHDTTTQTLAIIATNYPVFKDRIIKALENGADYKHESFVPFYLNALADIACAEKGPMTQRILSRCLQALHNSYWQIRRGAVEALGKILAMTGIDMQSVQAYREKITSPGSDLRIEEKDFANWALCVVSISQQGKDLSILARLSELGKEELSRSLGLFSYHVSLGNAKIAVSIIKETTDVNDINKLLEKALLKKLHMYPLKAVGGWIDIQRYLDAIARFPLCAKTILPYLIIPMKLLETDLIERPEFRETFEAETVTVETRRKLAEALVRIPDTLSRRRLLKALTLGNQDQVVKAGVLAINLQNIVEGGSNPKRITFVRQIRRMVHGQPSKQDLPLVRAYLEFLKTQNPEPLRQMGYKVEDSDIVETGSKRQKEAIEACQELIVILEDIYGEGKLTTIKENLDRWRAVVKEALAAETPILKSLAQRTQALEVEVRDFLKSPPSDNFVYLERLVGIRRGFYELSKRLSGPALVESIALDNKLEMLYYAKANELRDKINYASFTESIRAISNLLENVLINGYAEEEIAIILDELKALAMKQQPTNEDWLCLCAIYQRIGRILDLASRSAIEDYQENAERIGKAMGVRNRALLKEFSARMLRADTIYQLSLMLQRARKEAMQNSKMSEWQVIVGGKTWGRIRFIEEVSQLASAGKDDIIVINRIPDDPAIFTHARALIVGEEESLLSHTAKNARQYNIPFVVAANIESLRILDGKWVCLDAENQDVRLSALPGPEAGVEILQKPTPRHIRLISPELNTDKLIFMPQDYRPGLVGNKASRLNLIPSDIISQQINAPHFSLSFALFQRVLNSVQNAALKAKLEKLMQKAIANPDSADISSTLSEMQKTIEAVAIPDEYIDEVYETAVRMFGPDARLFIRSSTNAEDLEGYEGAGLYDSFGNVRLSKKELAKHIKKVWASVWNRRAFDDRQASNILHRDVYPAVLIQEMINPSYAFVINTHSPSSTNADEVMLEFVCGFGESLVSGALEYSGSPYRFIYNRKTKELRLARFANKSKKLIIEKDGTMKAVYASYKDEPILTPFGRGFVKTVAEASLEIEKRCSQKPQDIEGVITTEDGKWQVAFLQTRDQGRKRPVLDQTATADKSAFKSSSAGEKTVGGRRHKAVLVETAYATKPVIVENRIARNILEGQIRGLELVGLGGRRVIVMTRDIVDVTPRRYAIVKATSANPIMATTDAFHCIILTIYDPVLRIGFLAHFVEIFYTRNKDKKENERIFIKKVLSMFKQRGTKDVATLQVKLLGGTGAPHDTVKDRVEALLRSHNIIDIERVDGNNFLFKTAAIDTRTGEVFDVLVDEKIAKRYDRGRKPPPAGITKPISTLLKKANRKTVGLKSQAKSSSAGESQQPDFSTLEKVRKELIAIGRDVQNPGLLKQIAESLSVDSATKTNAVRDFIRRSSLTQDVQAHLLKDFPGPGKPQQLTGEQRRNIARVVVFLHDNFGFRADMIAPEDIFARGRVYLIVGAHEDERDADDIFDKALSCLPEIKQEDIVSGRRPLVVIHLENIDPHFIESATQTLPSSLLKGPDDTKVLYRVYYEARKRLRERIQEERGLLSQGQMPPDPVFSTDFGKGFYRRILDLYRRGYAVKVCNEDPSAESCWLHCRGNMLGTEAVYKFVEGKEDEVLQLSARCLDMIYESDTKRDLKEEAPAIAERVSKDPKATHIIVRGANHDYMIDALGISSQRKQLIDAHSGVTKLVSRARLLILKRENALTPDNEKDLLYRDVLENILFTILRLDKAECRFIEVIPELSNTAERLNSEDIRRIIRSFSSLPAAVTFKGRLFEVYYRLKANFPAALSASLTIMLEDAIRKANNNSEYTPFSTQIPPPQAITEPTNTPRSSSAGGANASSAGSVRNAALPPTVTNGVPLLAPKVQALATNGVGNGAISRTTTNGAAPAGNARGANGDGLLSTIDRQQLAEDTGVAVERLTMELFYALPKQHWLVLAYCYKPEFLPREGYNKGRRMPNTHQKVLESLKKEDRRFFGSLTPNHINTRCSRIVKSLKDLKTGREELAEILGVKPEDITDELISQLEPEKRIVIENYFGIGRHRCLGGNYTKDITAELIAKIRGYKKRPDMIERIQFVYEQAIRELKRYFESGGKGSDYLRLPYYLRPNRNNPRPPLTSGKAVLAYDFGITIGQVDEFLLTLIPHWRQMLERYYCLNSYPDDPSKCDFSNTFYNLLVSIRKAQKGVTDGWQWLARRMSKEGKPITVEEIKKNLWRLSQLEAECLLAYSGINQQRQPGSKKILALLAEKGIVKKGAMKPRAINNQIMQAKKRLRGDFDISKASWSQAAACKLSLPLQMVRLSLGYGDVILNSRLIKERIVLLLGSQGIDDRNISQHLATSNEALRRFLMPEGIDLEYAEMILKEFYRQLTLDERDILLGFGIERAELDIPGLPFTYILLGPNKLAETDPTAALHMAIWFVQTRRYGCARELLSAIPRPHLIESPDRPSIIIERLQRLIDTPKEDDLYYKLHWGMPRQDCVSVIADMLDIAPLYPAAAEGAGGSYSEQRKPYVLYVDATERLNRYLSAASLTGTGNGHNRHRRNAKVMHETQAATAKSSSAGEDTVTQKKYVIESEASLADEQLAATINGVLLEIAQEINEDSFVVLGRLLRETMPEVKPLLRDMVKRLGQDEYIKLQLYMVVCGMLDRYEPEITRYKQKLIELPVQTLFNIIFSSVESVSVVDGKVAGDIERPSSEQDAIIDYIEKARRIEKRKPSPQEADAKIIYQQLIRILKTNAPIIERQKASELLYYMELDYGRSPKVSRALLTQACDLVNQINRDDLRIPLFVLRQEPFHAPDAEESVARCRVNSSVNTLGQETESNINDALLRFSKETGWNNYQALSDAISEILPNIAPLIIEAERSKFSGPAEVMEELNRLTQGLISRLSIAASDEAIERTRSSVINLMLNIVLDKEKQEEALKPRSRESQEEILSYIAAAKLTVDPANKINIGDLCGRLEAIRKDSTNTEKARGVAGLYLSSLGRDRFIAGAISPENASRAILFVEFNEQARRARPKETEEDKESLTHLDMLVDLTMPDNAPVKRTTMDILLLRFVKAADIRNFRLLSKIINDNLSQLRAMVLEAALASGPAEQYKIERLNTALKYLLLGYRPEIPEELHNLTLPCLRDLVFTIFFDVDKLEKSFLDIGKPGVNPERRSWSDKKQMLSYITDARVREDEVSINLRSIMENEAVPFYDRSTAERIFWQVKRQRSIAVVELPSDLRSSVDVFLKYIETEYGRTGPMPAERPKSSSAGSTPIKTTSFSREELRFIDETDLNVLPEIDSDEYKMFAAKAKGIPITILIPAGGMGTRMGIDIPKAIMEVINYKGKRRTFLEIKLAQAMAARLAGVNIKSIKIMVSFYSEEPIKKYLEENNYFGFKPEEIRLYCQSQAERTTPSLEELEAKYGKDAVETLTPPAKFSPESWRLTVENATSQAGASFKDIYTGLVEAQNLFNPPGHLEVVVSEGALRELIKGFLEGEEIIYQTNIDNVLSDLGQQWLVASGILLSEDKDVLYMLDTAVGDRGGGQLLWVLEQGKWVLRYIEASQLPKDFVVPEDKLVFAGPANFIRRIDRLLEKVYGIDTHDKERLKGLLNDQPQLSRIVEQAKAKFPRYFALKEVKLAAGTGIVAARQFEQFFSDTLNLPGIEVVWVHLNGQFQPCKDMKQLQTIQPYARAVCEKLYFYNVRQRLSDKDMRSRIVIRPLNKENQQAELELLHQVFEAAGLSRTISKDAEDIRFSYVAEDVEQKKIVGGFQWVPNDRPDDQWRGLAVLPEYQYSGVGRLLFEKVKELARGMGLKQLFIEASEEAWTYYRYIGARLAPSQQGAGSHVFLIYDLAPTAEETKSSSAGAVNDNTKAGDGLAFMDLEFLARDSGLPVKRLSMDLFYTLSRQYFLILRYCYDRQLLEQEQDRPKGKTGSMYDSVLAELKAKNPAYFNRFTARRISRMRSRIARSLKRLETGKERLAKILGRTPEEVSEAVEQLPPHLRIVIRYSFSLGYHRPLQERHEGIIAGQLKAQVPEYCRNRVDRNHIRGLYRQAIRELKKYFQSGGRGSDYLKFPFRLKANRPPLKNGRAVLVYDMNISESDVDGFLFIMLPHWRKLIERYYCLNGYPASADEYNFTQEESHIIWDVNRRFRGIKNGLEWLVARMSAEGYQITAQRIKENLGRLSVLEAESLFAYSGIFMQRQAGPKDILNILVKRGIVKKGAMEPRVINHQIMQAKKRLCGILKPHSKPLSEETIGDLSLPLQLAMLGLDYEGAARGSKEIRHRMKVLLGSRGIISTSASWHIKLNPARIKEFFASESISVSNILEFSKELQRLIMESSEETALFFGISGEELRKRGLPLAYVVMTSEQLAAKDTLTAFYMARYFVQARFLEVARQLLLAIPPGLRGEDSEIAQLLEHELSAPKETDPFYRLKLGVPQERCALVMADIMDIRLSRREETQEDEGRDRFFERELRVLYDDAARRIDAMLAEVANSFAKSSSAGDIITPLAMDLSTLAKSLFDTANDNIRFGRFGLTPYRYGIIIDEATLKGNEKDLIDFLSKVATSNHKKKFTIVVKTEAGKKSLTEEWNLKADNIITLDSFIAGTDITELSSSIGQDNAKLVMAARLLKNQIGQNQPIGIIAGPDTEIEVLAENMKDANVAGVFVSSQKPPDITTVIEDKIAPVRVLFEAILADILPRLYSYDPKRQYSIQELINILPPITAPEFLKTIEALRRTVEELKKAA